MPESSLRNEPRLGLDIGGTAVKVGVLAGDVALATLKRPTPTRGGPEAVVDVVVDAALEVVRQADVRGQLGGIGVGVPGRVDDGVVYGAANLPGWDRVPLAEMLQARLQQPVAIENDANVAALGEYQHAAAADADLQHFAMLTLGTGIGGGLVVNGELVRGRAGWAGEIGHLIVEPGGTPCGCGQRGCLEQYASASALLRRYREATGQTPPGGSREICERARGGDADAVELLDDVARYLGLALVNLTRLIDPQMILLGGGLAGAGDALFDGVRQHMARQTWRISPDLPVVAPARLGADAGWRGAAALTAAPLKPLAA